MNNLPTFNQPLQSIGAVSSRQKDGKGKLFGYNTDYVGAISSIEDGLRGIMLVLFLLLRMDYEVFSA